MAVLAFATGTSTAAVGSLNFTDLGSTVATYMAPDAQESMGIDGESAHALTLEFPAQSGDFWVSFYVYHRATTWSNNTWFNIRSGTDAFLYFNSDTTENTDIFWHNGSNATTVQSNADIGFGTLDRIDIEFVRAVSGAIRIYKNNVLSYSYLGDTTTNTAQPDNITFGCPSNSTGATVASHFSSVMVADEDTRAIIAIQNTLTGNGLQTDMTGSYTDVDELGVLNDADKLISDAINETQTLTKSALPAAYNTGYEIIGLGIYARAAVGIPAISNMEFVQTDNTNTATSGDKALDGVLSAKTHVFTLAPDGTAWDVTKLNNTDIGIKSKT